jgi:hypothetical protein
MPDEAVQPAPVTLRRHVQIYDLNENEELDAVGSPALRGPTQHRHRPRAGAGDGICYRVEELEPELQQVVGLIQDIAADHGLFA